jgi:tetratricopeptide (TPR) repeat protein
MTDLAVPFITRPDLLAHMHYILSMHQLRYVEEKNFGRAEHHILQAVESVRTVDEQPFLKAFIDNGLALLRVRQGRHQEALDLCKNAYASVTDALGEERHLLHRSVLQYNMAQVYNQLGRLEESLEHYDHAIQMDPYYTEYYAETGSILTQLERHQEAIDAYAKAIAFSPPYPEVYFGKAICHARLEQWHDALACSGIGLELNPMQPDIRAARAEILTDLGEIEQAIIEYDSGIALNPDSIAMRVNRAVLHYNVGSFDCALADMNHVIAIDPREPAHYENRAAIYQAMDQHDLHQRDLAAAERHKEAA